MAAREDSILVVIQVADVAVSGCTVMWQPLNRLHNHVATT